MVMDGVFAQSDIGSPYSRFGLGTLNQRSSNTVLEAMGGVGYAMCGGSMLNIANPASYAAIDTLTFLFDAGFYIKTATFRTTNLSEKGANASFDYANFGFGITKWWKTGLGIVPFSNKEYESIISYYDPAYYQQDFLGSGGLNEAYWANGFRVTNDFYLGFTGKFMFGTIYDQTTLYFPDSTYMTHGRQTISTRVNDFKFDLGAMYTIKMKGNSSLTIGATYTLPINFNVDRTVFIRTIESYTSTTESAIDTIKYIPNQKVKVKYPQGIGFGLTYRAGERLMISADIRWDNWKAYSINGANDSLQNSWRIAVGGCYKPKSSTVSGYMTKVTYRAGFHYDQTYLNIYGQSINKFGLSVGLGLPMPRSLSAFNVAFEVGRMGTTDKALVKETYFNISVGVSIHDVWFMKRKYR